jgi:methyltransferase-like protein/2-polyprenyl-3-methyl-5-hydroxy-6-metoxy-1,4-benzoquinol methylase
MNALAQAPIPAESAPYSYDVVPYESFPYDFTQPQRMAAIGKLFGMTPPEIRTARVLELGCAGGGNLLPLAARYPDAIFVGVDLGAVQIGQARDLASAIGAKNIEFHHMSISDVGPDFGHFDYIVCHGVFSWVPAPVREAIFRVFARNLTPHGLALVSYNTLPGWHQVKAVRDMMNYHCARFADPAEKVSQGLALLRFVLEGIHPSQTAYRELIQKEIELLANQRASYIFHEHLEEINHPMHLHEVAAMGRRVGLEYVGDANLELMYLNNFPENVAKTLAAADDIVRIEQYLDFIANRRFRISLFCGRENMLRRNLEPAAILDFHLGSRLTPSESPVDLTNDAKQIFKAQNGAIVTTENRYATALMQVLAGLGQGVIGANDAVRQAASLVGGGADAEARVRGALIDIGLKMVFSGMLTLHAEGPGAATEVSSRPVVFAPARAIAQRGGDTAPSLYHQRINLGPADRVLMQACDGSRDVPALAALVAARVKAGELAMQRGGQAIADPSAAEVEDWVQAALANFARIGLLAPHPNPLPQAGEGGTRAAGG